MRTAFLVVLAACSGSASPEAAQSAKPRDAAPRQPTPPGQEPAPVLAKAPPCGTATGTTAPKPVAQLVIGGESCARLVDGSVWCWGGRGSVLTDPHTTAPLACPVATPVTPFGVVDTLWGSNNRSLCATTKGVVRCGIVSEWGFQEPARLDARLGFEWVGPCGIAHDGRIRCGLDANTKQASALGPADGIAITDSGSGSLCVLSRTAVSCLRDGKIDVLASSVTQIAAGQRLWALRSDGTVVLLDWCAAGETSSRCSIPVGGIHDATAIASGGPTVCALRSDGRIACASCESNGCKSTAKLIDGVTDAIQVAVGWAHACALRKNGEVVCWGASNCGQAGGSVEAGKRCAETPTVLPPTTIQWAK